jgi:hypothetical protein
VACLISCFVATSSAQAQEVVIHNGFITGNDYRTMSQGARRTYVMGLIDGLFLAPFVGAPKRQVACLERCAEGMRDEQVIAIVDKYISENPVRWHGSVHVLVYSAMREACVPQSR